MKTDLRNNFINNDKVKNLDFLLKEKILYENICYKHDLNYSKYCSTCGRDICFECDKEYHLHHNIVNYENLMPDVYEINSALKNLKQYENDNNIFMEEINSWKREFNNIMNEYIIRVKNIIELLKNFNYEKMNLNLIYKYRLIYDILSEYEYPYTSKDTKEKNKNLMHNIEKHLKEKEKLSIKNDCNWLLNNITKLKEFNKTIKSNFSFSNIITKIIDIIEIKEENNFNKEITPNLFNKIRMSSSYDNNKTAASSGNNRYNKKIYNNTIESLGENDEEKNMQYKTSKSLSNVNDRSKIKNLKFFGIYERKTIRQKSMESNYNMKKFNLENDLNGNYLNVNKNDNCYNNNNYGNGKIKMNKNSLQNSINDTRIFLFKNPKDRNKIKLSKTKNFINETVFNNYNKFQNNIKISKPEAFINTSYSNKGTKNISKLFKYNNSLDKINTKKEINNIFLINKNNNQEKNISCFNCNENKNKTRAVIEQNKQKKNNSVENTIKRKNMICFNNKENDFNDIDINYNQTYDNKKEIKLYVHKKFITLDMSKSLSSFESNTSSLISSSSSKNNAFMNERIFINNQYMNKTKTNYNDNQRKEKLYIGLELGNTECIIGLYNKDFNLIDNINYLKVPTIISFLPDLNNPNKLNIKIGTEAEKYRIENYTQTIFNIIKLFGQNNNDIFGKKELWPFNIYNDSNMNKPLIKIKHYNKDIYYNIEDILYIFLKKLFEMFFANLDVNKKYLKINIAIAVPNYFNYSQRKLLKNIFITKLFQKKTENKYHKYNIDLKNIYIENISNLISYNLFENNFQQKFNIYNLIISIGGCSTNISLVKLSKENKNNFIEIKYINNAEFGEEDFLDNLINSCFNQFKEKIRNNCLNSPLILARLRKVLNETKDKFDKEEITNAEINMNRLIGNYDLKLSINIDNYYTACIGLFRKIIFLIKETIINSGIDIEKIDDVILVGKMACNTKLKKMMSELFKERNENIYNKLTEKSNEKEEQNLIINGALIHCYNKSIYFPQYKIINISPSSIGIENYLEQMEFIVKKGEYVPMRLNKYIKIKKPNNNIIRINIFEGENKYMKNNKLISTSSVNINNLVNIKKEGNYVELLFQIIMDSNYNLSVFLLDKNTFKRQFECLI